MVFLFSGVRSSCTNITRKAHSWATLCIVFRRNKFNTFSRRASALSKRGLPLNSVSIGSRYLSICAIVVKYISSF